MFERFVMRIAAALLLASATAAAMAQTSAGTGGTRAAAFVNQLQRAMDAGDRRAVAALVSYPATVLAGGFNIPVKDAAAFIRMYKAAITPEVRCAVVQSRLPTAEAPAPHHPVTVTPDGLFLADGAIWAPLKNGRYVIARIRVLPTAPSVEGRRGVERVTFDQDKGQRTASFAGWLVRHNVDVFEAAVRQGETLQARIDGFRGHDATVRIERNSGPQPPTPASDIGRTTAVVAPADGDYRVEVVHLAPYCDPPQRYRLTLTIR